GKIAGLATDGDTAKWLATIGAELADKLAAVGLIAPRQSTDGGSAPALGEFVEAFIASRGDWKPNTRTTFLQTRVALVRFFGEDRRIDQSTGGDADDWAAALRQDYAPATVATFVKRARQLFRHAARKGLIGESPFLETRVPSQVNQARAEFIDRAIVAAV